MDWAGEGQIVRFAVGDWIAKAKRRDNVIITCKPPAANHPGTDQTPFFPRRRDRDYKPMLLLAFGVWRLS